MIPVEIDRRKWGRGEGATESRLLNSETQQMCCLGFVSLACGLTEEQITNKEYVSQSEAVLPQPLQWLLRRPPEHVTFENMIAMINDDEDYYDEKEREDKLQEIFAEHDLDVKFTH